MVKYLIHQNDLIYGQIHRLPKGKNRQGNQIRNALFMFAVTCFFIN